MDIVSGVDFIILIILAVVCLIDIKAKIIPDFITLPGMVLGLIWNLYSLNSILGIIVGILAVYLLNQIKFQKGLNLHYFNRLEGGDAKLMAMLGAFLGWQEVLIILLGSIILSWPYKAYLLKSNRRRHYPFSPFISLATLILFIYAR